MDGNDSEDKHILTIKLKYLPTGFYFYFIEKGICLFHYINVPIDIKVHDIFT